MNKLISNSIKILVVILLFISCEKDTNIQPVLFIETPPIEEVTNVNEVKKNYLALGDSYTIGQSVIPQNSFPYILVDDLLKKGISFEKPTIIAQTGWTTTDLTLAINRASIMNKYDLVTLLIGVNNQYQGKNIENYRLEYIELLKQAIYFANNIPNNVVVLSIPDWSVSPYALNCNVNSQKVSSEIDAFNTIKKEETLKLGVQFVNITEISRSAKGDMSYFASDGLHFSGLMHKLWVYELLKFKY